MRFEEKERDDFVDFMEDEEESLAKDKILLKWDSRCPTFVLSSPIYYEVFENRKENLPSFHEFLTMKEKRTEVERGRE
jgi:hypothetical protein